MPNPYIDNIQRWQDLSEVDYLGQFVKAWLAFNAWYRNAYTYRTDRAIIEVLKWQPNVVRDKIVPLISSSAEDGERFRSVIGTLHHRLENNHLHLGKGGGKDTDHFKGGLPQTEHRHNTEHQEEWHILFGSSLFRVGNFGIVIIGLNHANACHESCR